MKTLFRDFYLVDPLKGRACRSDLLVSGGVVEKITSPGSVDFRLAEEDEIICGRGLMALMPGFVNAHSHLAMTLVRGLGEDLPLDRWLKEAIWPAEARLTPELIELGALCGIAEAAKAGQTAFLDMYFRMDKVADAARQLGVRAALAVTFLGRDSLQRGLDEVKTLTARAASDGMLKVFYGPHAPYSVSVELAAQLAQSAQADGLPIHIHFLETRSERERLAKYGGPLGWLRMVGFDRARELVLAHGVWLTQDEIDELSRWPDAAVCHCPSSNLKLGDGVAPVREMIASGLTVGLGTDGPASNNRIDPWEEMRLCALLQKGRGTPETFGAQMALRAATIGGAKALGFEGVGLLREGWQADAVMVDLTGLNYSGADEENLAAWLVYAGSSADVRGTMVSGRWVWRDGRLAGVEEKTLRQSLDEARRELLNTRRQRSCNT
ncbi:MULTISPECIES: amidohydrolase family protein [Jonquetella]|uniref:Cytosine deaminase-like metal-dependent hydrolase n=1 Tax=Jonquetella anthropi DSM 22815 TaxID=885272 RepID=H0UIN5_9BACT|nr:MULTISPECIES: amidohydrolase [Jonquetella]EEX49330.1 amidohydrolase family protein [Jonquetella anthropi E3_33 E1]EHM13780.1 cytosine deaminase-like metal-dependent hydrolase [Jonquetella anthropi DSM 22815]ERL24229.1 amidohydrolase family protein [Jonquetella sp. BV3C21]